MRVPVFFRQDLSPRHYASRSTARHAVAAKLAVQRDSKSFKAGIIIATGKSWAMVKAVLRGVPLEQSNITVKHVQHLGLLPPLSFYILDDNYPVPYRDSFNRPHEAFARQCDAVLAGEEPTMIGFMRAAQAQQRSKSSPKPTAAAPSAVKTTVIASTTPPQAVAVSTVASTRKKK